MFTQKLKTITVCYIWTEILRLGTWTTRECTVLTNAVYKGDQQKLALFTSNYCNHQDLILTKLERFIVDVMLLLLLLSLFSVGAAQTGELLSAVTDLKSSLQSVSVSFVLVGYQSFLQLSCRPSRRVLFE